MEAELKAYLDGMKHDLGELREQIGAVESRLETKIGAVESRLGTKIEAVESRLEAKIEAVETNLLTEFWKWGSTSDMRTRQAITNTGILSERLLAVEDRVSALERRKAS